jgi:stearoyl-CoA desaturase (delta-9 desaturase)
MGWLMFKLKPLPSFDNVADLKKDPILAWQHRYIHLIAVLVAFVFPASMGFIWAGWKAALGSASVRCDIPIRAASFPPLKPA